MIEILTDVVLNVAWFQLLLLAAVLLVKLPRWNLRRNLLVAFLLSKAFLMGRWFALRYQLLAAAEHPLLYLSSCAGFFLLAPLLFLYVRALCFSDFRLTRRHLLHLLPTAVMALFSILAGAWDLGFLRFWYTAEEFVVAHFWKIFWTTNLIQILLYIVAMIRTVAAYRRRFRQLHASSDPRDLSWLRSLLLLISLHWLFVATRSSAALFELWPASVVALVDLFSIVIFLVFTTVLVIRGLTQLKFDTGILAQDGEPGPTLSPAQMVAIIERLRGCMRFEKPHLDPMLGVEELARRLELPQWQLSRALNQGLQLNFFNFVNGHRVEEAKRQLRNPACNAKTMLQILHESGFNSKSTFNEAFKRQVGMTPSQYRRSLQKISPEANEMAARS